MKFTANESTFCQSIAITSLLAALDYNDFLDSDYYKELRFDNEQNIRAILAASGLGNPATMQMFLYSLLVMPRELLKKEDEIELKQFEAIINSSVPSLVYKVVTTYNGEKSDDPHSIDYYRHLRNAVAHSSCFYETIESTTYVTFKDQYEKQSCEIQMTTENLGLVLEKLQMQMKEYLNGKWSKK